VKKEEKQKVNEQRKPKFYHIIYVPCKSSTPSPQKIRKIKIKATKIK